MCAPLIRKPNEQLEISSAKRPNTPDAAAKLEVALNDILTAKLSGEDSTGAVRAALDTVGRFIRTYLHKRHPLKGDGKIDDIAQEVLLKVWRNVESYDPTRTPENWLATIAARTAIDLWRRDGRGRTVLFDPRPDGWEKPDAYHPIDTRHTEPATAFFQKESRREIREMFEAIIPTLPTHVQETMTLRMDGRSNDEIAEQLKIPMGTVKSRLHLGMRKLEEALADYTPG